MEPTIYYRPIRALLKEMFQRWDSSPGKYLRRPESLNGFFECKQSVTVARVPTLDLRR